MNYIKLFRLNEPGCSDDAEAAFVRENTERAI